MGSFGDNGRPNMCIARGMVSYSLDALSFMSGPSAIVSSISTSHFPLSSNGIATIVCFA